MVLTILNIISGALPLIDKLVPDEATKIKNKVIELRKRWDDEYAKGEKRDDNALDHIESELCELGELFTYAVKKSHTKD